MYKLLLPIKNLLYAIDEMMNLKDKIKKEIVNILQSDLNSASLQKLQFLSVIFNLHINQTFCLKRSIFYESVPIFKKQIRVNNLIKLYTDKFQCSEIDLNIQSGLKGIYYGNIKFQMKHENDPQLFLGKSIIPDMNEVVGVECSNLKIIIIEKETIFDQIIKYFTPYEILFVCGKGYPCKNTIKLLELLSIKTPFISCLTDFDPFGLHIFLNYKKYIKNLIRIGIGYEDIFEYPVNRSNCIELNKYDLRKIQTLKNTIVRDEAEFIEGIGLKMEMEILFNEHNFDVKQFINGKIKKSINKQKR